MRLFSIGLAIAWSFVSAGSAQTLECGTTDVSISGGTADLRTEACNTVASSRALFDQCNMRPFPSNLHIEIIDEIDANCVGLYHCGVHSIEVLSPKAMEAALSPDSIYEFMPTRDYFHSVITHELSHATYDGVSCPFETCVATNEYVAYSMQILSLPPHVRAMLETDVDWPRVIHRDEINPMILYMAPDVFALKAWQHFLQQDDACGLVEQIMDGQYYFDHDMP